MIKKIMFLTTVLTSLHSLAQKTLKDTCKSKNCEYKVYYHPNGIKKEEGYLINGKKEGVWNEYAETDGVKRFEWLYTDDEKNGVYNALFKDGKINAIGQYVNGSLNDTLTIFDEQGQVVSKSVWKSIGNKKSKKTWQEVYNKSAKPDGTIEYINGKKYYWQMGEKLELKN